MKRFLLLSVVLASTTTLGCALLPGMGQKSSSPSNRSQPNTSRPGTATSSQSNGAADENADKKAESPKPTGPKIVSVSLKNECRETVKLFYGKKPKYGSGTYSSLGSNTRTSKQMKEGDMIWLVDDSQNGIGSVSISSGSRNVEILKSCTGIVAR